MKRLMTAEFFASNRTRVMKKLQGGVLVITAYGAMQRSNDAAFRFEQEANFWYLTGIERPDWWLIIDSARAKTWLVQPDVDPVHALFDGSLSLEEATRISGIKDILSRTAADELLTQTARQHRLVYTVDQPERADEFDFFLNPTQRELRDKLSRTFVGVQGFGAELARLRAIKHPLEVKAIEAAIKITEEAFSQVHDKLASYAYEYEIEAEFTSTFRRRGASGHAYDPIVGSGANACTLHYIENNAKLKKKSLVLLDIGAQVEHYAADITRTYAYGEPSQRQREVHAAVQAAHIDIIGMLGAGVSISQYYKQVDIRMKSALLQLGLITGPDDDKYRTYFPHAISHGLGIDVHDALGKPTEFLPGMVLTVEPGIYIPEEGIGVRIEDDILITDKGRHNLSHKLPTNL